MALSKNTNRSKRGRTMAAPQLATTLVAYKGSYMAVGSPDHATSATRGRAFPFNDVGGAQPWGFALAKETGDTAALPIPEVQIDIDGGVVKDCPVTGLAGTVADVGQWVYPTDDGTFTLTRPTLGFPIGKIVRFGSASIADVYFYSMGELDCLAAAGAGQTSVYLGSIQWAAIADGNVRTGILMPHHGKILAVYAMVSEPMVGAGGTALVNLEIAAVDVTGGVVTVSTAAGGTVGTRLDGTAVTATNVFREGDALDVEVASAGGTRTSGVFDLWMEVLREPGL